DKHPETPLAVAQPAQRLGELMGTFLDPLLEQIRPRVPVVRSGNLRAGTLFQLLFSFGHGGSRAHRSDTRCAVWVPSASCASATGVRKNLGDPMIPPAQINKSPSISWSDIACITQALPR